MQGRKCLEDKRMRRLLFQTGRASHSFYGDHIRFAKERGQAELASLYSSHAWCPILRAFLSSPKTSFTDCLDRWFTLPGERSELGSVKGWRGRRWKFMSSACVLWLRRLGRRSR